MSTDGSGERIPEAPRIIAVETSSVVTNLDESSNMDGGGDDDGIYLSVVMIFTI